MTNTTNNPATETATLIANARNAAEALVAAQEIYDAALAAYRAVLRTERVAAILASYAVERAEAELHAAGDDLGAAMAARDDADESD